MDEIHHEKSADLTAVGSTRRGNHWALAVFSGMFFPVAWAAWYVRDERAALGPAQRP